MQTKLGSFAESWANIAVGFSVNYFANLCIFPLFGFHISLQANFMMGCIYTAISLVRSYILRRWFNGLKFGNKPAPRPVRSTCDMGVGCNEVGICYAAAHGEPDRCGANRA